MRGVIRATCAIVVVAVGCARTEPVPTPFDVVSGQFRPGEKAVVAGPSLAVLAEGSLKEQTGNIAPLRPGVEVTIGYDAGPEDDKIDPDTGEVKGRRTVQVTVNSGDAMGMGGIMARNALRPMPR